MTKMYEHVCTNVSLDTGFSQVTSLVSFKGMQISEKLPSLLCTGWFQEHIRLERDFAVILK